MEEESDLIILGSGSTAFAAALRAKELGKSAIMTEERQVGGTCANRGCLPSKNLIEAARILHESRHPRYPGLASRGMDLDFGTLVAQKGEVIRDYRRKKYESLASGSIRIERGHARFVDSHTVEINGRTLTGRNVLIATGSRPNLPKVEGLDKVPYLTSDLLAEGESQELREVPRSLIILGGGYIALELGQMFERFGSKVTILDRGPEMLSRGYEPEVGRALHDILEQEGVSIVTGATIEEVSRESEGILVRAVVRGQSQDFRAERLLVAAGRSLNTDSIGIERSGVKLSRDGAVIVDETLRTNVPHIFAAGDVIGRETQSQMATPVGSHDGGIAAHNALSNEPPRHVDRRIIPRVIFTDPPVTMVGMTDEEASGSGRSCWCNTVPLSLVPRAGAIRDTRGLVKMVADDETDEVLGVSRVGRGAEEVIHEAAMALRFRAKVRDFVDLLHVYPTMSEALKIVAISRYKDPAKLSCCAE